MTMGESSGHTCICVNGCHTCARSSASSAFVGLGVATLGATFAFGNVASAVSNVSTCAFVCAADNDTRSRLVPSGTVGGRIAFTSRPCSRSCSLARSAASGAPMTSENTAESAATSKPSARAPVAKCSMCCQSF